MRNGIECQLVRPDTEVVLQNGNDQHMVFALRKPGYGDRPDTPCTVEKNRESSAVRCEIAQICTRLCLKCHNKQSITMEKKLIAVALIGLLASCTQDTKTGTTAPDSAAASIEVKANPVTGPMPGTVMTKEYVYWMGKQMYFWGWPLVNLHNRVLVMEKVPSWTSSGFSFLLRARSARSFRVR